MKRDTVSIDDLLVFKKADKQIIGDYLYTNAVDKEEQQAACLYEYARELKHMRDVVKSASTKASYATISPRFFYDIPKLKAILECGDYPAKGWNQISKETRRKIALSFPEIRPLRLDDIRAVNDNGVLDALKAKAETASKDGSQEHIAPLFEFDDKYRAYLIIPLEFWKGADRMAKEFRLWLKRDELKQKFEDDKWKRMVHTGLYVNRLCDLSRWRLIRCFGGAEKAIAAFNKCEPPKGRDFFRAGQGGRNPSEGEMQDERQWKASEKQAERFLVQLFPQIFGTPRWAYGDLQTDPLKYWRAREPSFLWMDS